MAEITEVVDGVLRVTKTPAPTVETMTKDEVIGKRAEAQTTVDHLNIDLVNAQVEVTKWDNYLKEIDKQKTLTKLERIEDADQSRQRRRRGDQGIV